MRWLYGLLTVPVFAAVLLAAPKALPNAADVTVNAAQVTDNCPSTARLGRFGLPPSLDFSLSDGWNGSVRLDIIEVITSKWDGSQESLTCTYGAHPNRPDRPANTYVLVKSFSGRECRSNGEDFPTLTCAR